MLFSKKDEKKDIRKDIMIAQGVRGNAQINNNTLVIGNKKSGKYKSFIVPNLKAILGSYIITDNNNIMYDKTNEFFQKNGYEIIKIDLDKETDYNPFLYMDENIDIEAFSQSIAKGINVTDDIFYEDICEIMLEYIVQYTKLKDIEKQNLYFVTKVVEKLKEKDVNYFFALMSKSNINIERLKKLNNQVYALALDMLKEKLEAIGIQNIKNISSTSEIDFSKILTKRTIVYINLNESAVINGIFFKDIIKKLYNFADRNILSNITTTYFILDNFDKLGYISMFDKKIMTSKSRKIVYCLITDNIAPLLEIYKSSFSTIISACDLDLYLGTDNFETIKYISENLGGSISEETLQELYPSICIAYEKNLAPIKAVKLGEIAPSEDELKLHKEHIFQNKEEIKQQECEARKEKRKRLIDELEEKIRLEKDPKKKVKLEQSRDLMKKLEEI